MENSSGETAQLRPEEMPGYERGQHPNSLAALRANEAATQFGGENANPQYQELGLPHPESIRKSVRYLMRQMQTENQYGNIKLSPPKKRTPAQEMALKIINIGLESKDVTDIMRVAEYLTDQTDGKLTQVNLNAEMAALQGMSLEQLREYDAQLTAQLAAIESGTNLLEAMRGEAGDASPDERAENAGGEIGGTDPPADAPGL